MWRLLLARLALAAGSTVTLHVAQYAWWDVTCHGEIKGSYTGEAGKCNKFVVDNHTAYWTFNMTTCEEDGPVSIYPDSACQSAAHLPIHWNAAEYGECIGAAVSTCSSGGALDAHPQIAAPWPRSGRPEGLQVHLTLLGRDAMAVSWAGPGDVGVVEYGPDPTLADARVAQNTSYVYTGPTENMATYDYCGPVNMTRTLHSVALTGLPHGRTFYRVRSQDAVSDIFNFALGPSGEFSFFAVADFGVYDYCSAASMLDHSKVSAPDLVLHAGDIAYNLDVGATDNRGDLLLNTMMPLGSTAPYMYVPGNHESDCNFTYGNYLARFRAQAWTGSGSARYYSFEHKLVHFVGLDTDAWGFDEVAYLLPSMTQWLADDLAAVDRTRTPWIVLFGHRPMYCSEAAGGGLDHPAAERPAEFGHGFARLGLAPPRWGGDCTDMASRIRDGIPGRDGGAQLQYGIEHLMDRYKVDLYITGHVHNYERSWPVLEGQHVSTYDNPGRPVHILTGSAGAYGRDPFGPPQAFDAFRSSEWSYSRFVVNTTHLSMEQRRATNDTVLDSFTLSKMERVYV